MSDLASLRLFVRAAETGSLSEAARLSNLALAAASRRIALLEHRYKVTLFHRSRRGMALTPAGRAFLDNARVLLDHAQAIEIDMADFAGGVRGKVRLQANPSAITQFLAADLAAYARIRPDVRIDLEENMSPDIVELIGADRADLGIIIEGTPTYQLATLPYRSDRLALVAPRGRLGGRSVMSMTELYEEDFIGLVGPTALTRVLVSEAAKADRKLRLRMQVRSFDGVCRMVEAGFGLGVLPETAARGFAASMALDVSLLSDAWAVRRMLICFSPAAEATPITRGLADHLHRLVATV